MRLHMTCYAMMFDERGVFFSFPIERLGVDPRLFFEFISLRVFIFSEFVLRTLNSINVSQRCRIADLMSVPQMPFLGRLVNSHCFSAISHSASVLR